MTALTDAEREALLVPCACGHTLNDHGTLCWLCGETDDSVCSTGFEDLLATLLAPLVAAREAAAREQVLAQVEALADGPYRLINDCGMTVDWVDPAELRALVASVREGAER